jgi:NADPH:quinone reductase-like Zn-dependent oxidoreductase
MASQNTALVLTEIGKPLIKTTLPVPEPKEDQLLIKVTAAGREYLFLTPFAWLY